MPVKNRKEIEKLIYDTFDALDPSGANTDKYRKLFTKMNANEFEKFMKSFLADDSEHFALDIVEFERDLKMDYCEKAAKVLGMPLYEYVYMPHLTMDKKHAIVSKEKCLVGYLNIKRVQQLVNKKQGYSTGNNKLSALTGQVISKDKNSRDSDIESELLVAIGADKILAELNGPRADDPVMKREMNEQIATKGYVELETLTNSPVNKITLNTVNAYFMSAHIKTDLITDTYILPKVLEEDLS